MQIVLRYIEDGQIKSAAVPMAQRIHVCFPIPEGVKFTPDANASNPLQESALIIPRGDRRTNSPGFPIEIDLTKVTIIEIDAFEIESGRGRD
jgi:hypothetical protein